ncbi:MAG: DUF4231 domain-containing protein [Thermoleophilaceae bacterium]
MGATAAALLLVAFAAVMGVVSAPWAGWAGAAAFLGAIVVGALAVTQNLERTWYDGRALAESAKSLTWLYVARGGDLAASPSPDDTFRARLRALRDELERLDFVIPAEGSEISDGMRELHAAPLTVRRELYMRERVGDQVAYYRRRGEQHRRYARRFRAATWAAQTLGLGGAVLKATSLVEIDLLGMGAAAAAALTAWLQTRDHVTLERAYELTAEDLDAVKEDAPPDGDEAEWVAFLADAESAMSREHVMWLARRGRRSRAQ